MNARSVLSGVLLCAAFAASPVTAETAAPAVNPAKAPSRAPAAKSVQRARPEAAAPSRTLESIHIKGEIAVPQVLFITARDQRRFMDFQHRHYLKTSREVGERTAFPSRIALTGNRPDDERKEKPQ